MATVQELFQCSKTSVMLIQAACLCWVVNNGMCRHNGCHVTMPLWQFHDNAVIWSLHVPLAIAVLRLHMQWIEHTLQRAGSNLKMFYRCPWNSFQFTSRDGHGSGRIGRRGRSGRDGPRFLQITAGRVDRNSRSLFIICWKIYPGLQLFKLVHTNPFYYTLSTTCFCFF